MSAIDAVRLVAVPFCGFMIYQLTRVTKSWRKASQSLKLLYRFDALDRMARYGVPLTPAQLAERAALEAWINVEWHKRCCPNCKGKR
jgi:hypothetical protein